MLFATQSFLCPSLRLFPNLQVGGREVFVSEETEVDLAALLSAAPPRASAEPSLRAHWLAVNGVQPLVPENPVLPPSSERAAGGGGQSGGGGAPGTSGAGGSGAGRTRTSLLALKVLLLEFVDHLVVG